MDGKQAFHVLSAWTIDNRLILAQAASWIGAWRKAMGGLRS